MSDRSTRSSTRSKKITGQSNGKLARRRVDEQLGDLEFSDWYESSVFEPSSEERFEAMATSGRAPARFLARVVIAAGAIRDRDRNRGLGNEQPDLPGEKGEPVNRLAEDLPAEPADSEIEPAETSAEAIDNYYFDDEAERQAEEPETADQWPVGEAAEPGPAETEAQPVETERAVIERAQTEPVMIERAETDPAETEPALIEPDETEPALIEPIVIEPIVIEPVVIEPGAPEPLLIPELAERMSFRQKASALLDRWAEKEVAIATKLDDALVPSISWSGRKKPAHARRNKSG